VQLNNYRTDISEENISFSIRQMQLHTGTTTSDGGDN